MSQRRRTTSSRDLDKFLNAYIEAALWSSNDESDDNGGEPMNENYGPGDLADSTKIAMQKDCASFVDRFDHLIGDDDSRAIEKWGRWPKAGHDFWLSRNGHGAGFFDGDWPQHGDELQEGAESYGAFELYVGDDEMIYAFGHEDDGGGRANERLAVGEHRDPTTGQFAPGPGPSPTGEWAVIQRMMKVYAEAKGLGAYVHNSAIPTGRSGEWRFWAQKPGERSKEHQVSTQHLKNAYGRGGLSERRGPVTQGRRTPQRRYPGPSSAPAGATRVRDYDVVDSRGRRIAGPFKQYDAAKRSATDTGGVPRFVAGEVQDGHEVGCPMHGTEERVMATNKINNSNHGNIEEARNRPFRLVALRLIGNGYGSKHKEVLSTFSTEGAAKKALDERYPRYMWESWNLYDVWVEGLDRMSGSFKRLNAPDRQDGAEASRRRATHGGRRRPAPSGGHNGKEADRGSPRGWKTRESHRRHSVLSRHDAKRMVAETRRQRVRSDGVDAEAAGERYAEEQVNSDYFNQWVFGQMVEGRRMRRADPKSVIPLEDAADYKKLARNILQQLGWDMDRDMDMRAILDVVGADDEGTARNSEIARDFGKGVRAMLFKPSTINALATDLRRVEKELKQGERGAGRKAGEPTGPRLLPPAPTR